MAEVVKKTKVAAEAKEKPVVAEKKLQKIKKPKTITAFYRSRDKNPEYFLFTAEGNLGTTLTFNEKGAATGSLEGGPPVKLFDLPLYTSISREEIDTLWANRESSFNEIYESIEKAKSELRNAHAAFQAGTGTVREVVIANQLVADEEAKLIANRSPKRWIQTIEDPKTNYIDLKQKYETRKIGFDVFELKQVGIDPQNLVRPLTEAEAAVSRGGGTERVYAVITDQTLLGLHWPADIKVGNTQYFTAFQAILGEAARQSQEDPAKYQELFQSILGTRSQRTLRNLTKDMGSDFFKPEILDSVITAISKQFPEFRELLLKTGDDELVYANVLDTIFSVGLEAEDPNIQDAKQWRGENLWGKALEKARMDFREMNVTKKVEEEGISKADEAPVENMVISKEKQDAAKKAAIINARRFHKNH